MQPTITLDQVRAAVAACQAAGRRIGLRSVWREIVATTGQRPSFSTVSRLLAESAAQPTAPEPSATAAPDQILAQLQQLAPAVWQAAQAAARQELTVQLSQQAEALAEAATRERDLLAELDEAQARASTAEEAQRAAEERAEAATQRIDTLAAAVNELHAAHRAATDGWAARERELHARCAQLEREAATLAASGYHDREDAQHMRVEVGRVQAEHRELERRIDTMIGLQAHLTDQVTTRDADIATLRTELAASRAQERAVQQMDTQLRTLRAELVRAEGRTQRRLALISARATPAR